MQTLKRRRDMPRLVIRECLCGSVRLPILVVETPDSLRSEPQRSSARQWSREERANERRRRWRPPPLALRHVQFHRDRGSVEGFRSEAAAGFRGELAQQRAAFVLEQSL